MRHDDVLQLVKRLQAGKASLTKLGMVRCRHVHSSWEWKALEEVSAAFVSFHVFCNSSFFSGWRPQRVSSKPARSVDLVDLKKTFGISFRDGEDDDTDSSDAEFAPENECIDSEGWTVRKSRVF